MSPDEFIGWLQRIANSPADERRALERQLVDEVRAEPFLTYLISTWQKDGRILFQSYMFALNSVLAASEVAEADKFEALREAEDFAALMIALRQAEHGLVPRVLAFRLAADALFAGLNASLTPQLARMQKEWQREKQRRAAKKGGEKRRRERRWVEPATEQAKKIRQANPTLSQEDVAAKIVEQLRRSGVEVPGARRVIAHVSELEKGGVIPKRAGSFPK